MKFVRFEKICWFWPLWALAATPVVQGGVTPTPPQPSADEVIQRAVQRAEQAEARSDQAGYTYTKITLTEEFDSAGRVKERKEKVYRVYFKQGETLLRLVSVNGKPPGAADLKKLSENETNVRQLLGPSKSRKPAGDNRENFLTPEIVARFQFTLEGEKEVNGRRAYQIGFQPKSPELPVHRMIDRLLNRLSGKIWIDAEEFEIAHAEISLASEVDLLGGMIGSLKKLVYTLTRTRVAEGLWINSISTGDFEGRKLLESMKIKTKSNASDFRPLRLGS